MRANREDKNTERQFPAGGEKGGDRERSRGKMTKRQSEESAFYGLVSPR